MAKLVFDIETSTLPLESFDEAQQEYLLREAEKITPGFESPTVSKLEEAGWFSVRAMVKSNQVIEIMEQLEALGATAILETTITNCRL